MDTPPAGRPSSGDEEADQRLPLASRHVHDSPAQEAGHRGDLLAISHQPQLSARRLRDQREQFLFRVDTPSLPSRLRFSECRVEFGIRQLLERSAAQLDAVREFQRRGDVERPRGPAEASDGIDEAHPQRPEVTRGASGERETRA